MSRKLTPEQREERSLYSKVRREAKRRAKELFKQTGFRTGVSMPTLREIDKKKADVEKESRRLDRWMNRETSTVEYQRKKADIREQARTQKKKTTGDIKKVKVKKPKEVVLTKDEQAVLDLAKELGIPGITAENAKLFLEYIQTRDSQTAYDLKYSYSKMKDEEEFDMNKSYRARRIIPSEVVADFGFYLESRNNQVKIFSESAFEDDPFEDLF